MSVLQNAQEAVAEIFLALETFGLQKTAQLLSAQRQLNSFRESSDAKFVIEAVARAFKIPEKEITDGVQRRNHRRVAIGFCVHYLKSTMGYEIDMIALMLNRSKSICYKYAKYIERLDEKNARDRKFIRTQHILDQKINSYHKTKLNHPNGK